MQVVVLYSQALGMERGKPEDILADQDTGRVAQQVAAALEPRVKAVHLVPVWEDVAAALAGYDPATHLVFNLCESLGGRSGSDVLAARQIRELGFAFTGASEHALGITADKLTVKKILKTLGLPTPRHQVVSRPGSWETRLPFPAIVKPSGESGSVGLTQASVAVDSTSLYSLTEECLRLYAQPALVEEYIVGREINVAIWGNGVPNLLPIAEIEFTWTEDPLQKFLTFASKWMPESEEFHGTPGICPARLAASQRCRVEEIALHAYTALGMSGPARIDMRLKDDTPYILEVNANPDLAPEAGFFRSAAAAGYSYDAMVARIADWGLQSAL